MNAPLPNYEYLDDTARAVLDRAQSMHEQGAPFGATLLLQALVDVIPWIRAQLERAGVAVATIDGALSGEADNEATEAELHSALAASRAAALDESAPHLSPYHLLVGIASTPGAAGSLLVNSGLSADRLQRWRSRSPLEPRPVPNELGSAASPETWQLMLRPGQRVICHDERAPFTLHEGRVTEAVVSPPDRLHLTIVAAEQPDKVICTDWRRVHSIPMRDTSRCQWCLV